METQAETLPKAPAIRIEWVTDSHECETCGSNYADGAYVHIDGREVLDLSPAAACYGGTDYSEAAVLKKVLEYLGHEITEEHVQDSDEDS